MSEQNIAAVKKIDAAFAGNEIEDFYALCDENIEWTMAGHDTVKGLPAIRKWMDEMEGVEPPKIDVHNMFASDDSVAAHGSMTMKNKDGEFEAFDYCDLYRFNEAGKVTRLHSYVIKKQPQDVGSSAGA